MESGAEIQHTNAQLAEHLSYFIEETAFILVRFRLEVR